MHHAERSCTAWCSGIGSLTSLNACDSGASSDVREPISLHRPVQLSSQYFAHPFVSVFLSHTFFFSVLSSVLSEWMGDRCSTEVPPPGEHRSQCDRGESRMRTAQRRSTDDADLVPGPAKHRRRRTADGT